MDEFVGEKIEVEKSPTGPQPLRFKWRGGTHEVAEILLERVDIGHGDLPSRSRKWYTRHHRRYFRVRDTDGNVFEIYLDYGDRSRPTWWLLKSVKDEAS
jgi:hypothetical protein